MERRTGVIAIGRVQRIVRVVLVGGIEWIVRGIAIRWVDRIAGIIAVRGVKRIIRRVGLRRIQRIVRHILIDWIEDVVIALVLLVEARIGKHRCGRKEQGQKKAEGDEHAETPISRGSDEMSLLLCKGERKQQPAARRPVCLLTVFVHKCPRFKSPVVMRGIDEWANTKFS